MGEIMGVAKKYAGELAACILNVNRWLAFVNI
jgi:hypothetical protein